MELNKKYFLHLEGMDLAGKSTIARKIKERSKLEWVINNNRLSEKNNIYTFTNEVGKQNLYDDEIYGYLYYVALMADIKKFKHEKNIIQDSTLLLRSINYHINEGNDKLVRLFEDLVDIHPVPDISIYLTTDIESRIKRLATRIQNNPESISKNDSLILTDPEKFVKMDMKLSEISQKYFNSYVLDTSKLNEDEVVDHIFDMCDFEQLEKPKLLQKKR